MDLLEPADGRAVEHEAVGEDFFTERHGGHGEVLHRSRQVTEPDVDELHVFLRDKAEDLFGTAEHQPSRVQGTLPVLKARDWDVSRRQFLCRVWCVSRMLRPATEVRPPIMARRRRCGPEQIPWCRGQEIP